MQVPDKIYIGLKASGVYTTVGKDFPNAKEYICKDALLEYLTNKIEQMRIEAKGCYNMTAAGKFLALKDLVEKIESL